MSTSSMDLDRVLKAALAERAAGGSGNLLEEIVGTAVLTPQRPSVWSLPVLPRRLALVAAATLLLAALLGAVALLAGVLPDPDLSQNGPITIQRGNPVRLWAVDPRTHHLEELAPELAFGGAQRPTAAPGGTAVAFARGMEVWVLQGGGEPRHVATCSDGTCEGFEWSADGTLLAFGWGYREVEIVEIATGRLFSIATDGNAVVAVSWSPDGRRLAVVESTSPLREFGESLIRVSERDGSGSSLLYSGAGHRFADVAWSPDGTTLALLGLELDADSALTTSVVTLNLGDGTLQKLVELEKVGCAGRCPGYPQGVAWSPDQTQLAVVARNALYVVNADGTDLRRIMGNIDGSPVWVSAPAHD